MHEIKSFNIMQTAKVMAVVYGVGAAVVSVFVAFGALIHGHPGRAIGALIVLPLLYAVGGFIMTAFSTWLYNEVAARLGGIELEVTAKGGA